MTTPPAHRRNGPWAITDQSVAYQNPWVTVDHHEVIRPDGVDGIYGVIRFANLAIGVLPLFADGTVPLVGQHRFPFDAYSWELPEGGGPKDEPPEAAARRELLEETGLRAANLVHFGQAHLSNSVTDERAHYYLAWDLTPGPPAPEGDEVLAHRRIPFGQLVRECLDGTITDSLTILMVQTAILKAQYKMLPDGPGRLILGEYENSRQDG